MKSNRKITKTILKEYTTDIDNTLDPEMFNEPSSYSRSSVGRDFREKIFDLEHSNTILF